MREISLKTCLKTAIILFYLLILTYQSQIIRKLSSKLLHKNQNYLYSGSISGFRLGLRRSYSTSNAGGGGVTKSFYTTTTSGGSNKQSSKTSTNPVIPLALGLTFIATYQLYKISKREDNPVHTHTGPFYFRFYASLPLRYLSQTWGYINSLILPIPLRVPIYKTYAYLFNCNLDEVVEDLESFQNLGEFFYRKINLQNRPIANDLITSPSDGLIVNQGIITDGDISHVKGMTYSLDALLGPGHKAIAKKGNQLYFAVIYLAPGDYHHFHSPTDMVVERCRQFQGEMFSVSPSLVEKFNVFIVNERVSIEGHYKNGFCGMVCVAATNVGNLVVDWWKDLKTNYGTRPLGQWVDEVEVRERVRKGGHVGGFKLGSTVVVVWEGRGLKFRNEVGDRVKLGQGLCY